MTARAPTVAPSEEPESEPDEGTSLRRLPLIAKVGIGVFLVASIVMWSYALFGPRHDPPGTLDDASLGSAAEDICAPVLTSIEELPLAQETPDPQERADVVDQANQLLAAQLSDLDELASNTTLGDRDRGMVDEWLEDWHTYVGDRQAYAGELRVDADARMLETPKEERPISFVLTQFAEKNAMPSCAPPGDVG